jgi:hypothetical protein
MRHGRALSRGLAVGAFQAATPVEFSRLPYVSALERQVAACLTICRRTPIGCRSALPRKDGLISYNLVQVRKSYARTNSKTPFGTDGTIYSPQEPFPSFQCDVLLARNALTPFRPADAQR